jgi:hypothetical protein
MNPARLDDLDVRWRYLARPIRRVSAGGLAVGLVYLAIGCVLADDPAPKDTNAPAGLHCQLLSRAAVPGITDPTPKLGWVVPLSKRGDRQKAHQVLAASSKELLGRDKADLWDSGEVESAESINVAYAGKPLEAAGTWYWKVRTWNQDGAASQWSEVQSVTMASEVGKYQTARHSLETNEIEPMKIERIGADKYFVDFGKDAFGFLRLDIDSTTGNQPIVVRFGEKTKSPGQIDRKPGGTIRSAQVEVKLDPERKAYEVHPAADQRNTSGAAIRLPEEFGAIIPFRYVELENCPVELKPSEVRQVVVHYPFDDTAAAFRCSDERLNRIWDVCKHTIKATTFAGVFVDGDRERIPYEADAYINQLGHYAVDREFALARYSHEYLLKHPTWPTEWKQHSIFMAWPDYLYTGNRDSLAQNYETLRKKTLEERAGPGGLLGSNRLQVSHDDIVDWPAGERDGFVHTPVNAVVNAFYYRCLVIMGDVAEALDKAEDAARYRSMAAQVFDSFNRTFFDAGRGIYVDGQGTDHGSLHANMFALDFGLVPDAHQKTVVEFVKSRGMACSVYGAQYLLEALYGARQADSAFDLMTADGERGWLHMLDAGSTMTWEAWDIKFKPNLDWNHAWGTAPVNIIPRYLLGVRPIEPGFGKVLIEPQPGPLKWAEGTIPTIRGPIHVRFDKEDAGGIELKMSLPANMTARVGLPAVGGTTKLLVNGETTSGNLKGSTVWLDDVGSGENRIRTIPKK